MSKTYYVYMLQFLDGSYYAGITNNIWRRLSEHRQGIHPESYVSKMGKFEFVYVQKFLYVLNAIAREKQLKNWSRAKKDALVTKDIDELRKRAKKNFPRKPKFFVRPSNPKRSEGCTEV